VDPAQTLEDVQSVHRALVTCGAPIEAINTIRKHISAVIVGSAESALDANADSFPAGTSPPPA